MANVAFGVRQTENGIGTTDTDIRHMLAQKWLNKGVVGGLHVSGGSTMAYNVSAGMAICSRGASDGFTEAYWSGGATPTVEANSSPNPRIDVVWITAHDMSQGDADNLVTIGVTKGTAAANPSAPTIPTYATEVARMLLPGGATTTKNATVNASISFAIPYGATLGILGEAVDTRNAAGGTMPGYTYDESPVSFHLPTDRIVQISYSACFSSSDANGWCSWGVYAFLLDGEAIPGTTCEWLAEHGTWSTHEFSANVEVPSGSHTVAVRNGVFSNSGSGVGPVFHYGLVGAQSGSKGGYPGRTLRVTDLGPVK